MLFEPTDTRVVMFACMSVGDTIASRLLGCLFSGTAVYVSMIARRTGQYKPENHRRARFDLATHIVPTYLHEFELQEQERVGTTADGMASVVLDVF